MSDHNPEFHDPKKYWLDDFNNVKKVIAALFVVCAGLFLADFFYHKHSHFEGENIFGFYALYGFFMCVGLVLAAKLMRIFLMRDEGYYDNDE